MYIHWEILFYFFLYFLSSVEIVQSYGFLAVAINSDVCEMAGYRLLYQPLEACQVELIFFFVVLKAFMNLRCLYTTYAIVHLSIYVLQNFLGM